MTDARTNPLWTFTLALRDERDAWQAWRSLRERGHLDVNVVLFCAWAGRNGHGLTIGQIERLCAVSSTWQQVVTSRLGSVRACLATPGSMPEVISPDDGVDALTAALAAAQDEADRVEQNILYRTLPLARGDADIGAMVNNIHAYFGRLGRAPGPDDTADLVAIVLAGLPSEVRALDLVRRFEDRRELGVDQTQG
jgi:uncharacterized protein (TIGR02444 family)